MCPFKKFLCRSPLLSLACCVSDIFQDDDSDKGCTNCEHFECNHCEYYDKDTHRCDREGGDT